MKKAIFSMFAALLMSVSFGASAQTIPTSFKTSVGDVFTLDGIRSFECVTGGVKIQHQTEGFQLFYPDTSNVCARVTGSIYYQTYFVTYSGDARARNSLEMRRVYPDSGNSKIIWKAGPEEVLTGMQFHTAYSSRAQ